MNIHEYQAADLLARYGIPTNPGSVATTPDEVAQAAKAAGGTVVVKAQVHTGGRGKAGGVKLAKSPDEARAVGEQILGMDIRGHTVHKVLVAPGVSIAKEFYLGVVLDRPNRKLVVMASAEGGVEIEIVAKERPDKIKTASVDPYLGLHAYQARQLGFELGLEADKVGGFADIVLKLAKLYQELDATLAEINPLILTGDGTWMALDSKVSFDDNALFRHSQFEELRDMNEEQATEVEARRSGISFVKLDGNIGCIVNGAGLAMATMDAVKLHGGEPANFLDVGGGASADQVAKAFSLVTADPNVKAILINIFGGITRGDIVAQGITDAMSRVGVTVPIVVRLSGTNAEAGREILDANGLHAVATMDEAAAKVVAEAAA
ncbi:MAG TPA: ADP-forming succinate--CoA ligase subunit beta [Thermomicrobiales bacterium]|nr:ADP-forming succinate--CoA ligase subunit beta [Thermomicrobiales bacterium]